MQQPFRIRRATAEDIAVIAHHRAAMFLDIGTLTPALVAEMEAQHAAYLHTVLPTGEYAGWLASPERDPSRIVAGAGVLARRIPPFPGRGPRGPVVKPGRQGLIVDVYTEASFRRQGLASGIMQHVLGWAKDTGIESLVLHAAPDGRPLYEALGFSATSELRFAGDLALWKPSPI